jgi:hypothetical protein
VHARRIERDMPESMAAIGHGQAAIGHGLAAENTPTAEKNRSAWPPAAFLAVNERI